MLPDQTPQVSSPPPPPSAPVAPQAGLAQVSGAGASVNASFTLDQLLARRSELSNQLTSLIGRREDVAKELIKTPADSREGLQQVITVLDARRVQLENDIATNGQAIVQARADAAVGNNSSTSAAGAPVWLPPPGDLTAISVVFTLFVLCPIALSMARLLWKRGNVVRSKSISRESDQRMERVEQAVDAIAVEIERISEGQRFVTQLLARAEPQPVEARLGHGEPVRVPVAQHAAPKGAVG